MKRSLSEQRIQELERALVETLEPLGDPDRAQRMRAYMRGKFEFLGIPTPIRRAATLPILQSFDPVDAEGLLKAAWHLWKKTERDYTFAALDLLDCHQAVLHLAHVGELFKLVQQRSWWDSVDSLAGLIGSIVRRDKPAGQVLMDSAVRSEHLWVRRVAMLHQLGWRGETDTNRLFGYAELLAAEKDFFIRKAIGWALRDYAKHDRRAVENFVRRGAGKLSPLSCREALLVRSAVAARGRTKTGQAQPKRKQRPTKSAARV